MSTTETGKETLTVMEAAKMLGIGRSLAYKMFREGSFPGQRKLTPRKYLVSRRALEEYLESTLRERKRMKIVAEIGNQHNGSIDVAHTYIDAVAKAGADAVKFQCHIAAAESTLSEPWRVKFTRENISRYEYWERMEFTPRQWIELAAHAHMQDLEFIVSPFSIEAVEMLDGLVDRWKVASGEVGNTPLLKAIAKTGKPVVLSSGMSDRVELAQAVSSLGSVPWIHTLQCTSKYPCPPEEIGLNLLNSLHGLSDHSGSIYTGLAAAALGAEMLEVHVCFSKQEFGPDVSSSITIDELRQLVEGVRWIERIITNPVDKDEMAQEMQPMRDLFTKSITFAEQLKAGTILEERHFAYRKPGTGIPAADYGKYLGRVLAQDVPGRAFLQETMLR